VTEQARRDQSGFQAKKVPIVPTGKNDLSKARVTRDSIGAALGHQCTTVQSAINF